MQITFFFILVLSFILNVSTGNCFIPELKYILESSTKGNRDIKSYKIIQEKILYDADNGRKTAQYSEKIFIKQPWKYLRISTKENSSIMMALEGSQGLIIRGGKWIDPEKKLSMPFIMGFYLSNSPEDLSIFLSTKGIKKPVTKLFKVDNVVGILMQDASENSPSLCVDRESYWPIAYYYGLKEGKDLTSSTLYYEFSDYRKVAGRKYWPMKMKVFKRGILTEEIRVKSVEANVKVPDKLFSINYLKKKYEPALDKF